MKYRYQFTQKNPCNKKKIFFITEDKSL